MRISDWSSDVCSSDLSLVGRIGLPRAVGRPGAGEAPGLGFNHRFEGVATQCPLLLEAEMVSGTIPHKSRPAISISKALPSAHTFLPQRSDERRVGKECVSTCRSRWSPYL